MSLLPAREDEIAPLLPDTFSQHRDDSTWRSGRDASSSKSNFYWKLVATMFDFFVIGMAMAAVGVFSSPANLLRDQR